MKIFRGLFLCLLFIGVSYAQTCPKITYKAKRIKTITGFNTTLKNDQTCNLATNLGTISSFIYADDDSTEPIAIVLQYRNGRREQIGLDNDSEECFSRADKRNFDNQLKKGARVKVTSFVCGVGGDSDKQIFSIDFL